MTKKQLVSSERKALLRRRTITKQLPSTISSHYQQQGFAFLGCLLDPQVTKQLKVAFMSFVGDKPESLIYGIWRHNVWKELPCFHEALLQSQIGSVAAALMNVDELLLFQDTVILKPSGIRHRVQWHQDYSYWPLDSPNGITIWIALDDTDKHNGCMSFIPHSHEWGECQPMIFTAEKAEPKDCALPPLRWQEMEKNRVDYPCKTGFAAAMHPLNCHMSYANLSTTDRLGWVVSFVTPEVRWDPDHAVHPYNYLMNSTKNTRLDENENKFVRFKK